MPFFLESSNMQGPVIFASSDWLPYVFPEQDPLMETDKDCNNHVFGVLTNG